MTGDPTDKGRFKPPSLRNIAVTAPYMHDGSIATLEEVIDHYARGGRLIESGPYAGDGKDNPNKSVFVKGFVISDQEKQDLLAFLRALTDDELMTNPAYGDPSAE
jgi:cytochrome c peroxidase